MSRESLNLLRDPTGVDVLVDVLLVGMEGEPGDALSGFLGEMGYNSKRVETGLQAIEEIKGNPYIEMVFCSAELADIPAMDLPFLVARARREQSPACVLCSAASSEDVIVDAFRSGYRDFLSAPVEAKNLVKVLQSVRRQRAMQDIRKLEGAGTDTIARSEPAAFGSFAGNLDAGGIDPRGVIRSLREMSRSLRGICDGKIYGDAALEITLVLLKYRADNADLSVSDACELSGTPFSTTLRLVRKMEEAGLLEVFGDPHDKRRNFIALKDDAYRSICSVIERSFISKRAFAQFDA